MSTPVAHVIVAQTRERHQYTIREKNGILEFSMSSKKEAPFNHPRLAGDASLGLSPIHNLRRGKLDEPATSSPMTSLLAENAKIVPLSTNQQPFQVKCLFEWDSKTRNDI